MHLQCLTYTNVCSDGEDFDNDVSLFQNVRMGKLYFPILLSITYRQKTYQMYSSMNYHKLNTKVLTTQIKKHTATSNHCTRNTPCTIDWLLVHTVCTAEQFSRETVPVHTPISRVWVIILSHLHQCLAFSIFRIYLFWWMCGGLLFWFQFHVHNYYYNKVNTFTCLLAILFQEMSVQDTHFFKGLSVIFLLIYMAFSMLSKYQRNRIFIPFTPVSPEPRTELVL